MSKTLEEIAIENGATKKCDKCKEHLEFPTTFCSGCGMHIGNCLCLEDKQK